MTIKIDPAKITKGPWRGGQQIITATMTSADIADLGKTEDVKFVGLGSKVFNKKGVLVQPKMTSVVKQVTFGSSSSIPKKIHIDFTGGETYIKQTIAEDDGLGSGPYPYPWVWMQNSGSYVGGTSFTLSNHGTGKKNWYVDIPNAIRKVDQSLIPSYAGDPPMNYQVVDNEPVFRTVRLSIQKYDGIYYLTMSPGSVSIEDILVSCQSNALYGSYAKTGTGPTEYSGTYYPPGIAYSGSDSITLDNFVVSAV